MSLLAQVIAAFSSAPERAALVSDFDGTLAPIVEDPASARPLSGAPALLAALARRCQAVAVVSGRPAAFLARVLGPEVAASGVLLFGLYGMERVQGGEVVAHPEAQAWRPAVASALARARDRAPRGVGVEDKGLSFTLHWRGAPDPDRAAAWAREMAAGTVRRLGLEAHPGRMSLELLPPLGPDKGQVVEEVGQRASCAVYLGDDRADLAGFDALDRLAAGPCPLVLRVAVASAEAPPELLERADHVVEGPAGALGLLARLAEAAGGRGA